MKRIAIVGPGAIGGTVAAWLHQTKRYDVVVCGRRKLTELTVEIRQQVLRFSPVMPADPDHAPAVDWILVATKVYDSDATAPWIAALGRTGAPVAVLQNGIEHVERFTRMVPPARIVPVVVNLPCERLAVDHIRQRAGGRLTVPDDILGREFTNFFSDTVIAAEVSADFKSVAWRKLCLNAVGVISALTLRPAGVMREEAMGELGRAIVRECVIVGRAEGVALDDALADRVVQDYRAAPEDAVNSLHADRAAGRPLEIDARNGVIVRLGAKHGISTPYNQMAVTLLESLAGQS